MRRASSLFKEIPTGLGIPSINTDTSIEDLPIHHLIKRARNVQKDILRESNKRKDILSSRI